MLSSSSSSWRNKMSDKVMKVDDIAPDSVRIVIDWDAFTVGASMFIPCVDTSKAKEQVKKIALRKNYEILDKICVENNMLGIRFWRTA